MREGLGGDHSAGMVGVFRYGLSTGCRKAGDHDYQVFICHNDTNIRIMKRSTSQRPASYH